MVGITPAIGIGEGLLSTKLTYPQIADDWMNSGEKITLMIISTGYLRITHGQLKSINILSRPILFEEC